MSDALVRFLADRSALGDDDQRELLEAMKRPDEAVRVTELLAVDGLLSRALSPDRADFRNRVFKRIAMLDSQRHFAQRVVQATSGAGRQRPQRRERRPRSW
nr:hypothetical protein [Planctomycetota bacterium]